MTRSIEEILKDFPSILGGGKISANTFSYTTQVVKEFNSYINDLLPDSVERVKYIINTMLQDDNTDNTKKTPNRIFYLSKILGIDSTILRRAIGTKNKEGKAPPLRWLPYTYSEKIAHLGGKMSCHELYTGEKGMTLLPHRFSAIVQSIQKSKDPDKKREEITAIVNATKDKNSKNYYNIYNDPNYGNFTAEMSRKRLDDICDDRYISRLRIIRNLPSQMGVTMSQVFRGTSDPKYPNSKTRTPTVISVAFIVGTTVDYFCAIDYLRFTKAYYYSTDGEKQIVKTKDMNWLRTLVSLPDDIQERVMKDIYVSLFAD